MNYNVFTVYLEYNTIQQNLEIRYTYLIFSQTSVTNIVLQLLLKISEKRFATLRRQIGNVYLTTKELYSNDTVLKNTHLLLIIINI